MLSRVEDISINEDIFNPFYLFTMYCSGATMSEAPRPYFTKQLERSSYIFQTWLGFQIDICCIVNVPVICPI